ncbi:MAG TPA: nuclear transport factor 2 family protein [Solirubrobacterales bacterium]|nr:nuclear transport factor 2 family protein [Solirubrobacterales bacterium]
MSGFQQSATAFVAGYGRTWQSWDVAGFVSLFSDDVVYVVDPERTVVGSDALQNYVREEQAAQGDVSVRMGNPMIDGEQVMAEFWVKATNEGEEATIAGCLIARLDPEDGRCTHFREYWFDLDGHLDPYRSWGT